MKRIDIRSLTIITFFVISFSIFTLPASAQNLKEIELDPQIIPLIPKEYFIKQVIDGRKDKGSIGLIITSGSNLNLHPLRQSIILKGGIEKAIEGFVTKSQVINFKFREVIFHIKELKVSEDMLPGGLIKGRVQTVISFEMASTNGPIKLIDYKGGLNYTRSLKNFNVMGPVLANTFTNGLKYFDTWINREAATNEKLAQNVKVSFTDVEKESKDDTLWYSNNRPLAWKDFKSKTDASSRFAAELFAFFSFEERSEIKNGVVNIGLKLKIYMVRSFSWVKDFAQNSYTLNHEQRHFDIVKIAAERFKKKINNEKLTVENYQGIFSVEYLESLREMNRLQELYDGETSHGIDQAMQIKWNLKLDKELESYNIGIKVD